MLAGGIFQGRRNDRGAKKLRRKFACPYCKEVQSDRLKWGQHKFYCDSNPRGYKWKIQNG